MNCPRWDIEIDGLECVGCIFAKDLLCDYPYIGSEKVEQV